CPCGEVGGGRVAGLGGVVVLERTTDEQLVRVAAIVYFPVGHQPRRHLVIRRRQVGHVGDPAPLARDLRLFALGQERGAQAVPQRVEIIHVEQGERRRQTAAPLVALPLGVGAHGDELLPVAQELYDAA